MPSWRARLDRYHHRNIDAMPGDPKECRFHAVRCAQLAAEAKTADMRATFLGLSKQWEKFATELEKAHAFIEQGDADFRRVA